MEAVTNVRAQEPVGPGNSDDGDDVADETWAVPGEGNLLDDTNRAIIESLQRDGRRPGPAGRTTGAGPT